MELTHRFPIDAPLEVVWDFVNDLERMAASVPGAELAYAGGMAFAGPARVELGPDDLACKVRFEMLAPDLTLELVRLRIRVELAGDADPTEIAVQLGLQGPEAGPVEVSCDLKALLDGELADLDHDLVREGLETLLVVFGDNMRMRIEASMPPETMEVFRPPVDTTPLPPPPREPENAWTRLVAWFARGRTREP